MLAEADQHSVLAHQFANTNTNVKVFKTRAHTPRLTDQLSFLLASFSIQSTYRQNLRVQRQIGTCSQQ